MPKHIGQKVYYSIPEAAKKLGISRMTMFRWATQGVWVNGARVKVVKDPISRHHYIAEDSIEKLAKRFQPVS